MFAQVDNSGTDMHALSVQTEKLGISILNHANVQFHQPGMELLVLFVLEEEFTTTLPLNANAQADKLIMDMSVLLTAQLDKFIMKLLKSVLAQQDKTGMEISVFCVMVVKLGTLLWILVFAQLVQFGMDIHALILAMVEEF